jgi:hypothetical protein
MLLPGLDAIPPNSVTLLEPNARFIEAYMVGLNDELNRELLWREFPTDLRGTYFRQFWDVRGQLGAAPTPEQQEQLLDIPPIGQWQAGLGGNLPPSRGGGLLMLLIRGDLLARYPNALIYAAPARWSKNASGQDVAPPTLDETQLPLLPSLRVSPSPGVTLLGFTVNRTQAAGAAAPPGAAGYFFVIQEHPTESRFGLDVSAGALTSWRELAWPLVATRPDGSGYVALRASNPTLAGTPPAQDRNVVWGRNGGHMAYITLQKPYRLQIHATYWVPRNAAG